MQGGPTNSSDRPGRRFSRIGFKLVSSLIGVLVVCVSVEIVLRLFAAATPPPPRAQKFEYELEGLRKLDRLSYLTAPNVQGHYADAPYKTNVHGFQGRDYAIEKPANVHRTVVIGDSVAMGQGVLASESYPARVERALNAMSSRDMDFEILNLAVAGYNSTHAADRYRDFGMQFRPDLLLYAYTSNDLQGLPGYRRTRVKNLVKDPFYRPQNSSSLFVRVLYTRWRMVRNVFSPAPDTYIYELDENYFRNPKIWTHFEENLVRMKTRVESTGADS